jgi:hypothetical protein
MSMRVTQSRATSAYWLVAGAGLAGMIALSVAVFLTPPAKPDVRSYGSTVASVVKATQASTASGAIEHRGLAPAQSTTSTLQGSQVIEAQAIVPLVATQLTPVAPSSIVKPQAHTPVVAAATAKAPQDLTRLQTQSTHVTPKPAQPPTAPAPKEVSLASSSNRIEAPKPPPAQQTPIQQPPARQAETIVVKGYQQMALNVDGIGRGNSLTIQLPLAKRK